MPAKSSVDTNVQWYKPLIVRNWGLLAFSLLLLAACENRQLQVKVKQPEAATEATAQSEPAASQATAEPGSAAKTPETAALPPAPAEVDDDPDALVGLDREALEQRLGRPALVRLEDPAEVWQYRGEGCVFDLFFYPDNGMRLVVYLEARDLAAQPIETRPCLRGLLEKRAAKPVG